MSNLEGRVTPEQRKIIVKLWKDAVCGRFLWQEGVLVGFHSVHRVKVHGVEETVHQNRDLEGNLIHNPIVKWPKVNGLFWHDEDLRTVTAMLEALPVKQDAVVRLYRDVYEGRATINIGKCTGYTLAAVLIERGDYRSGSTMCHRWILTEYDTIKWN